MSSEGAEGGGIARMDNLTKISEMLQPTEIKVLRSLLLRGPEGLSELRGLKKVEFLRAGMWLENKGLIHTSRDSYKVVVLDQLGKRYVKDRLPEIRMLNLLGKQELSVTQLNSHLASDELAFSLGYLRKKGLIKFEKKKASLTSAGRKTKTTLEDKFLHKLAHAVEIRLADLKDEDLYSYQELSKRKQIVRTLVKNTMSFRITDLGKRVAIRVKDESRLDHLTPEIIKSGVWKEKNFRRYDVEANVPVVSGGKRHFLRQSREYVRRAWLDMGFKEMSGPKVLTGFWNFDVLFTAQDHPVREMQDTFYLKSPATGKIPAKLADRVRKMHVSGGGGSIGWGGEWSLAESKKLVLRTHTTPISAMYMAQLDLKTLPAKFFIIGREFRNETQDWSHTIEFYQYDGIVVDQNANFRHLLGYLKALFKKLGYEHARFRPAHFPYTEPSVEIEIFHPVHKKWIELGGAGMFRPEMTIPIFGREIPVLAWGPGFDRAIMEYYKIHDLREFYKNDLKKLREVKAWLK